MDVYVLEERFKTDGVSVNEFHVAKTIRDECGFDGTLFASTGNVILANFKNVRIFAQKINDLIESRSQNHAEAGKKMIKAGQLNAMGLIDEIFHYVCALFRRDANPTAFDELLSSLDEAYGKKSVDALLRSFTDDFPPTAVYNGSTSADDYLAADAVDAATGRTRSNRVATLEELVLLRLANENPAFKPFYLLFDDAKLTRNPLYALSWTHVKQFFKKQPIFGPNGVDLVSMLKEPVVFSPHSLKGQLDYIRTHWESVLGEWLKRLLAGIDMISEEEKPGWAPMSGGAPEMAPYDYGALQKEYERFSPDREWMPRVVLMAKTVLVWLDQLSKQYGRDITRLDQIPDEELDMLAARGFTGLWLIGLWERSHASQRIKQICGNPEAAASAYSLYDYDIAQGLGGWDALDNLRRRLWRRGVRLASDMVPNHTGMDSRWINERPDLFVQTRDCPFPGYTFNGENLSLNDRIGVYLEDHYYRKDDCAVVFKRVDHYTGDVRYIYHGNDGTGMPWNDTAQIDFLNPEAREAVIQEILHVARNFPIIRFDAAMVLAKKHIRRLWYPEPGQGGDIASRSEYAVGRDEFEARIPEEFWREVVDRVASELPDTLLLAEAFWMMEGYFVRTLGMHRVYNSAFMNMLKREDNAKYRATIKNTIEFDPQVLKRFVNFMNNPDEETAVAQFGKDGKYFGVCTLMVTMPGLPMFGHGQIEGFSEKYGMEFTKAYWNETPDENLIARHEREIFPLMKKRYLFAEIENFLFYDVWNDGQVNENVFAYSNRCGTERAVVFYNNVYQQASGWIKHSCPYAVKTGSGENDIRKEVHTIGEALGLLPDPRNYCIFREQRSGLWFIRSALDICSNGLYVHLDGFESQVLMDISQVSDDETGKYRILCDTLGGRGVADMETALREIFLKDLYKAFTDAATSEFFEAIHLSCLPATHLKARKLTAPALKDVLETLKPSALVWFETLDAFIHGNYGASAVLGGRDCGKKIPAEKIWKNVEKRLTAIVRTAEIAQKTAAAQKAAVKKEALLKENAQDDAARKSDTAFTVSLYEGMLERPACPEMLAAFALLYAAKDVLGSKATAGSAADLIELWGLERKLQDLLMNENVPAADSFVPLKTILSVLRVCDIAAAVPLNEAGEATPKAIKAAAGTVADHIVHGKYAPLTAGTNSFDNVLWFNAERMTDTVWYAISVPAFFAAGDVSVSLLAKLSALLSGAQVKAEYRAAAFTELLPLPEKARGAKKTAGNGSKITGRPARTGTAKSDAPSSPAKKPKK
ncbi:alpha-amylase family glycosyl hydrolase [Treponema brennaborense]|uniref:Alpha amylase catalytic region n=1 Tax=Treponema brennaborense (strain DSM 12168 / CIP 105900 / DD5/3) TaxID=906968 RepID=F4LL74_TREBD|nr:alpha-amylase family glycosyl hydrolase [Treponema brennaborense]AEE17648.1 alpha amylase catalytic region [Treponema brennaborense DSM 12168]